MNLGTNPLNLIFRFLLELTALVIFGYWGWKTGPGWIRYLLIVLLPLAGALIWGVFAVPDDPSRSGKAPIPVPGWTRLLIELVIFGLAGWALFQKGYDNLAFLFLGLVLFHYGLSLDRIRWLLKWEA